MDLGLQGKTAIVTGATANIGRAIALELAAEGVCLVAVGRDEQAGARVVEQALERGAQQAIFIAADLLDPAAPARILAAAEKLGPVAILVNGLGGIVEQGFFVVSDPSKWLVDIDLNLGTVLRMTQSVLPGMIARRSGSIINIGSTAGLVGDYMLPVYSAMKGAVHSFTQVLLPKKSANTASASTRLRPYATFAKDPQAFSKGSRFNPENAFFTKHAPTMNEFDKSMRLRKTMVGRPFATPEEMSGLVAYLASDRASFVTGQVWSVDGGSLL